MRYFNVKEAPIKVYGLLDNFNRLPDDIIDKVNNEVTWLATCTTGGRVRFETSSSVIEIKVKLKRDPIGWGHQPRSGHTGIDVYLDGQFRAVYYPGHTEKEFGATLYKDPGNRAVEINLPLANGVEEMTIGILDDADMCEPKPYKYEKPIVYYGSSITMGGCVSRPGMCYASRVARRINANHINLGFSGSALGEQVMADYIASLDMSAFVLDYDHNAPNVAHLEATHYNMYETVRKAHPDIPIIIVTKPDFENGYFESMDRRVFIMSNYVKAYKTGDRNVFFCDGKAFFTGTDRDSCTVDFTHPNDLGHDRMAEGIYRELPLR
jgi:hypothetical protein